MDDLLLGVDSTDHVVSLVTKYDAHRHATACLHRAFSVLVLDTRGERLFLQQRASTKSLFPSYWANTCCSHPLGNVPHECVEAAHEGVRRAGERRVNEELGAHLPADAMRCVFRLLYRAAYDDEWVEWEMDHVLVAYADDLDVDLNPDEVQAMRWVTRAEAERMLTDGTKVAPWFRIILEHADRWWTTKKEDDDEEDALAPIVVHDAA